jgi:hypothetical protein
MFVIFWKVEQNNGEQKKIVQKTHNMANEHIVIDNVCYESSWVKYPFFQ